METALQEAIEELNYVPMDKTPDYISGVMRAIKVLEKYFPKEREDIEIAWNKGAEQCYDINASAQEYYETNFNINKV